MTVGPMCSDLITNPREANKKVVTVQYVSPTVGLLGNGWKLVELRPGTATTPVVAITVDNEPQPRARFAFKSIAAKPIVNISSTGTDLKVDSLIGVDTLIVSLVGTTIDDETALSAQDTLIVIALPTLTSVPLTATLNAIGATSDLLVSLQDNATPTPNLLRGRVWWKSTDAAVVSVDSAGARISTGLDAGKYGTTMTAVANGTAQILTIVEGRDTARTTVTVAQALSRYTFAVTTTAGVATQPTISAVGDTLRVVARALDAKGVLLAPQPAFTLVSDVPAALSVHPDLGWAVGLATDTVNVRVAGRQSVDANEFIAIEILPKATNIRFPALVGGQVLMTAPNTDTTLTAIASDSRNVDINLANDRFIWTSSVQRVAQVGSDGKISARDTGTTVISASRDGRTVGFPVIVTNVPTTLSITPDPMPIRSLTETVQATTVARNTANGLVPNAVVTWTALDPTIATVNATGLVTGVAVGTARVVGVTDVGAATDTITVNVSNQPTSIVLGLASATLASINDTLVVSVTAKNGLGATLPATAVRWRSDASDVVKVSIANDGTIIALKRGDARIIAENADASVADTVAVTVTNAPATVVLNRTNDTLTALTLTRQYAATIFNARGGVIVQGGGADQNQLTWRSTDQNVAQIDALSGLATATGNGTALIIGETGSGSFATGLRADTAVLVVSNGAVAAGVNPGSASITSVGSTQQLVASATNNLGAPVSGVTFVWGTSDAGVATVSSTGLVTATGTGTATITATSGSLSATSTITVTNLPTSIDITLPSITFASVNDFSTLAATLTNAAGATLPSTAATWTSDDPLIALVTSDGTVTAKAPGSTKVRAVNPSNAAIRDSIIVTVSNAAATVTLTPGSAQTLTSIGQTLNLSTTVLNQAGQPISNPTVTWDLVSGTSISVSASGVGTGLVTALTNGAAKVRATSGSVSDTVDVIVAQAISPSQSTVSASPTSRVADNVQTSTVTVQLRDANGNNYVRAPAAVVVMTPSSGIPLTVTDNGNGNFTATHPAQTTAGTSTVTVTADGTSLSNSAIITFAPNSASQYVVSTSNATPVAGSSVTITAQLKDANGNNVATSGKTVTWSSSNGGSFGAATSLTNASGLATVTFTTATTTTTHAVTATDNTAITGTSGAIATTPGTPFKYLVSSSAASVAAGGSVTISAQLADANNNFVGTAGQIVTWTGGAGGSFGSATSATNSSGVATVTFTPSTAAGAAVTVTGTDGDARTGTTGTITTFPGAATQLTLTTSPEANPQSGVAFTSQPVVQLRDGSASQNAVPQANVAVTATISSGTGTLSGITTVLTNGSGVATFSGLAISGAASVNTISFTSSGLTPASANVTIAAGAAQNIVANSATSQSVTAGGAAVSPSVIVRDGANNPRGGVAVTFTVTAGGGTINPASGGTVTSDAVTGVATLTSWTTGTTAGTNTVTAAVAGLSGSPVTFNATGVAGLTTAAQSTVLRTGGNNILADGVQSSTIVVTAKDANGNPVAGKTVSLDDGAASSSISTSNATSDANGQVTFTVTNTVGETATYTATVTDGGAITVTQTAQVTFRAGTKYLVTSASATPTAGSTVIITAQLQDGSNQNVPQGGKTVVWSKLCNAIACAGDATGGSFATPTSLTDATGKATVALTVSTDASINMTVIATDNEALTGTSGTINVGPGAAATVRVETAADGSGSVVGAQSVASGSSITAFAITRDGSGNFVANVAADSWTLINKTGGVVDGNLVPAGDMMSAVFTGALVGTAQIEATEGVLTKTPSGVLTVTAGPAAAVLVETAADGSGSVVGAQNVSSGSSVTGFAITRDAAGNFVANVAADSWTLINKTGGVVNGDLVVVGGNMSATFTGALVGTAQIEATEGVLAKTPSGVLTVIPGTAAAVRVETAVDGSGAVVGAQNVTSGNSVTGFAITRDAAGNFVANVAADSWTLINKTGGVVNGDLVVVGGSMSATFTGALVGTAQIEATEGVLVKTPSGVLTVIAGAPNQVTLAGPASVVAGATSTNFTVTVRDAAGNPSNVVGNTTFTLATNVSVGTATFNPVSPVQVDAGTSSITFTYRNTVVGGGTHQISATRASGDALAGGASANHNITVTADTPHHITLTGPASVVAGATSTNFTLTVVDQFANPSSVSGNTTFDLVSNVSDGTATYTPTSPVQVNAGASSLTFTYRNTVVSGGTHQITATRNSGDVLTGTSANHSITVSPDAPQNLIANSLTSQSATVATAVSAPPSVIVRDQFNNPVGAGIGVSFTLTQTGGTGGAIDPASVATVNTNASGVATLTSWTLGQTAGTDNNTVEATIATLNTITFNASGTPGAADNILVLSTQNQVSQALSANVASAPSLRVLDQFSNIIRGCTITFSITTDPSPNEALINGATADVPILTDATTGNASLTTWTLGSVSGSYAVTGAAGGVGCNGGSANAVFTATDGPLLGLVSALVKSEATMLAVESVR